MAKRPVSAVGNRRPTSEFARMQASMGGNPRYKVGIVTFKLCYTLMGMGALHVNRV